MKRRLLLGGIIAAALLVVSLPMIASAGDVRSPKRNDRGSQGNLDVVGITADGRLIEFKSNKPKNASNIAAIWGLAETRGLWDRLPPGDGCSHRSR